MRAITPAPVRKSIFVRAQQQRAFEVFTSGIGRWWPPSHHIGKAEMQDAIIEPRAGGRWYERGVDGSECEWGRVLAWDPPQRVVLAWQLTADWQFDPKLVTEVEVRFTPEGEGTRVDLEHRNLERFGERADTVRGQIDAEGGWGLILQNFADAATA
ncbi:MAG TPA: SRPBCC family protein [Beijerinckiaceae bacterium]|nr:SRPBCC family protein [Beijerinckiaceae bacterium]